MADEFRAAGAVSEFYGELDTLSKDKIPVLVWQSDSEGRRSKGSTIINSYLARKDNTIINLNIPSDLSFNTENPVFIYAENTGSLFKGTVDGITGNICRLLAHDLVYLKEKRITKRMMFRYTKVFVDVTFGQKLPFKNLILKDISKDGFCVYCTKKMSLGFMLGLELNIDVLHGIEIPGRIEGKIAHISKVSKNDKKNKDTYIVGVSLNEKSKLIEKVIETLDAQS